MSVPGDTGYLAGGLLGVIETNAILQLDKVAVTRKLVSVKFAPRADTISWIMYNDSDHVINADDVVNTATGTITPTSKLQSVKKTATLAMHSVGTDLYDEAKLSNADDPESSIGIILGNAAAAKIDRMLNANFDNFSNAIGSTLTTGLTVDVLFNALSLIENYELLDEVSGVFDRRMLWGAYGLIKDLVTSNQFGGSPPAQGQALVSGWAGKIAGINLYNSNQLAAVDTATSSQKGGIFTRNAIGWGFAGNEIVVEKQRESKYIRDAYTVHGFWGTTEIHDGAGVGVLSRVVA